MKRSGFALTTLLVIFLPELSQARIEYLKEKGIFVRGSDRYYQIGEREFICNVNNRLSDDSAREILSLVKRIYESSSIKDRAMSLGTETIDFVWNTLHLVYLGEFYDDISFICLKYKLNLLFDHLGDYSCTPVSGGGNCMIPWDKGVGEDRTYRDLRLSPTFLLGRLAYEETGAKMSGEFTIEYYCRLIIHDRSFGYTTREDNIRRACDWFCGKIERLLNQWIEYSDESPLIDSELGPLMERCVNFTIKLYNSRETPKNKKLFDGEALRVLMKRTLETCLKCSPSEGIDERLIAFGKENNIPFKLPKEKKPPI